MSSLKEMLGENGAKAVEAIEASSPFPRWSRIVDVSLIFEAGSLTALGTTDSRRRLIVMKRFYFDLVGEVPARDFLGHDCSSRREARNHASLIAHRIVQRGASETGSASSQVLSAAQMLSGDSNPLKIEVSKFLETVRAA